METFDPEHRWVRWWAVAGVAALLGWAAWRLGARGVGVVQAGLNAMEWLVLALLVATFLYGEGVLALERRWVPKVLARARRLAVDGPVWARPLAPLHAMGLVAVPAQVALRSWAGVAAIVLAVALVRWLPDPWRAMVDVAVASALAWGCFALIRVAARATESRDPA